MASLQFTKTRWLPSWLRSKRETSNECHLRLSNEDLQLPVFTTNIDPASISCREGQVSPGDFSFHLGLTDLKRTPIVGSDLSNEEEEMAESSYDLTQSSSMSPLIAVDVDNKTKTRKRKSKDNLECRSDYFDATSDVEKVQFNEPLLNILGTSDSYPPQSDASSTLGAEERKSDAQQTWSQTLPGTLKFYAGHLLNRLHPKSTSTSTSASTTSSTTDEMKVTREEMLQLYLMKLEEESNYFDSSPSPEDEFCECLKCQSYYGAYYAKYFEEYERYCSSNSEEPIDVSILMEELMGSTSSPCSIM